MPVAPCLPRPLHPERTVRFRHKGRVAHGLHYPWPWALGEGEGAAWAALGREGGEGKSEQPCCPPCTTWAGQLSECQEGASSGRAWHCLPAVLHLVPQGAHQC